MLTVTIENKSSSEISGIIHELKTHGLIASEHYEFRYYPDTWDHMMGYLPKKCEFTFNDAKLASWFMLIWG